MIVVSSSMRLERRVFGSHCFVIGRFDTFKARMLLCQKHDHDVLVLGCLGNIGCCFKTVSRASSFCSHRKNIV